MIGVNDTIQEITKVLKMKFGIYFQFTNNSKQEKNEYSSNKIA